MARNGEISGIEKILKAQPEIVEILHDEERAIPEIDYSNFAENFRAKAAEYLGDIVGFLHLPYIIDKFTDHNDRRAWRINLTSRLAGRNGENLAKKVFDYYEKGSLRGTTHFNYIAGFVHMLNENYTGKNLEFNQIAARIIGSIESVGRPGENNVAAYHLITTPARIHYIRGLKQDIYALLKAVAKT